MKNDFPENLFSTVMGKELLKELDSALENFDKIFLLPAGPELAEGFAKKLTETILRGESRRKLLLLSSKLFDWESDGATFRSISADEENMLLNLYHLYDFSDRFLVIERSKNYGSIFNYVDQGLLTVEEAVSALAGV